MKARIKSNGKIVEVISRFMPRKRNAASRDWVCNLSDGTCIDESQLEYIEESIDGLDEAADEYAEKHGFRVPYDGSDNFYDDVDVKASKDAFIAGPNWQKQHDAELIEIAYNDGITIGMTKQKEQMMKEAVEGQVRKDDTIGYFEFSNEQQFRSLLEQFQDCDKVRIIIVKEDEK